MTYAIGTRGSRLSLAQTGWVVERLRELLPDGEFRVVPIKTSGDGDPRPLFAMNQKGIFEREIDAAVARGDVDLAVHSLKDVPSAIPGSLTLACVPKREDPGDVLITRDGSTLESLRAGSVVGTSSLRRAVQVRRARPDIRVRSIRGNVETRLAKVDGVRYGGVVLARAGISRLRLDVPCAPLPGFVPSPGQGSLAIVCRKADSGLIALLGRMEDAGSRLEAEAEMELSARVGSGCRFPVGALARAGSSSMTLSAAAFSVDGRRSAASSMSGDRGKPRELAGRVARDLLRQGAGDLAAGWRAGLEEWNG